jgi:hypothetical protein
MKRTTATPHTAAMPGLPPDLHRLISSGLGSSAPERQQRAIDACLIARAFAAGFVRGADPVHRRRRHVVDAHHEHWLAGYHAGRRAVDDATAGHLRAQLLPASAALASTIRGGRDRTPTVRGATASTASPTRARAIRAQPSRQLPLI